MVRLLVFTYGLLCYLVFLATFLYSVAFVGGFLVPKTVDIGVPGSPAIAVLVNLGLLSLFAIQHSVMARPLFKRYWTRLVPNAIERSTYVMATNLVLIILFWQWRPLPAIVWEIANPIGRTICWAVFWFGWGLALVSTFLIDHFDLFGLRQVYLFARDREYTPLGFRTPGLYRFVRHPLLLGFIIAFWAAPTMSVGHLLFAAICTLYMVAAAHLEERDLITYFDEAYARYRRQVGMLLPYPNRRDSK